MPVAQGPSLGKVLQVLPVCMGSVAFNAVKPGLSVGVPG